MSYTKIVSGKSMPNFCMNCIYFKKAPYNKLYPYCTHEIKVDNVDATVTYNYAHIYREYECKGKFFEEKVKTEPYYLDFIKKLFRID